jgi:four helix bundle protein
MATITRFEDIYAWQRGRELTSMVYSITAEGLLSRDRVLCDQIRRASVSIMLNIAEGFARDTNPDFARFLAHAHGSVAEVQSVLYIALDLHYIDDTQFTRLYQTAADTSRLIHYFSLYLRSTVPRPRPRR